jgi:hypothetical protein
MAGILSRKENFAASCRLTPVKRAPAIVDPDLEIPGIIAIPWIIPTITLLTTPISDAGIEFDFIKSDAKTIKPVTANIRATSRGLAKNDSNRSPNK